MQKAGQEVSALFGISGNFDKDKRTFLFNSMIRSQFSYNPLIWIFCSGKSNSLMNRLLKRYLRITTNDKLSDFMKLLLNNNGINFHQTNLQILMVEVYKIINGYVSPMMNNLFVFFYKTHNIRKFWIICNANYNPVNIR